MRDIFNRLELLISLIAILCMTFASLLGFPDLLIYFLLSGNSVSVPRSNQGLSCRPHLLITRGLESNMYIVYSMTSFMLLWFVSLINLLQIYPNPPLIYFYILIKSPRPYFLIKAYCYTLYGQTYCMTHT